VDFLRELGFRSFNFDLIYGLPGQNLEKFKRTLELTHALNPDRLAVYSYAHVPWKSPVQRSFKDEDLPSPELKLQLFEEAYQFFEGNRYHQVGMDHFALESDELYRALKAGGLHRNFMGYSTKADAHQIGFGISSISYVNGNYYQNAKTMEEYESKTKKGELTTIRGYDLTRDDHIRRDLITELMCRMEIDITRFEKNHDIAFASYFAEDLPHLKDFVADGLLEVTTQKISVLGQGKLVLRNIAMCFDKHLDTIRKTSKNPVFSRTV
jgi:oxygen-independent coproporphyrinogen-3 oxidase